MPQVPPSLGVDDSDIPPLPVPSPAIQLTPLFGSAPSDHLQTLHALYASQIATIIWAAGSQGQMSFARRSVVVGIALRQLDGREEVGLSSSERDMFIGIMTALQELFQFPPSVPDTGLVQQSYGTNSNG